MERSQISKVVQGTWVITAGANVRRFLNYQEALDSLPLAIKNYGFPASIEKETVYMILETID